jgi:protein tyrosine/serine phosphatase
MIVTHAFPSRRLAAFLLIAGLPPGSVFGRDKDSALPNFHEVNDQVYRGGQPSQAGLKRLAEMGVKTILDLREAGARSRREEQSANALGMRYINVGMNGIEAPSSDQIERSLSTLEDHGAGPIFVHCKRGADRTGMVIACYRIRHDGWDNKKALAEAKQHGMRWFQLPMQNYVLRYEPVAKPPVGVAAAAAPIQQ